MGRPRYYEDSDSSSYGPRRYDPVERNPSFYPEKLTFRSNSTTSSENDENCLAWIKYCIFGANVVFIVVGFILLAMGVWLRTDSRFRNFLSERYRQSVQEAFWEAPTLYAFSYIIIVLGCCMIVVAFFGCCGVTGRARPFLIVYALAVFLLLIATLSCGIYLMYKRDGIDVELSDALNYMVQHYYQGPGIIQESLDHLQQTFRCCGNAGCSDFRVFRQDPPRTCDIRCDGCHYRITNALRIGFSVALIVFSAVILCQLLALCLTLYLTFLPRKEVRVVYKVPPRAQPFDTRTTLTREALELHDMPFNLRKTRAY